MKQSESWRWRQALATTAAVAATAFANAAQAGVDVGVGITIREPGVYGRIEIGSAPPPRVIYAEPVVVVRRPVRLEPVYLYVPPGHAKNWAKHCHRYDACHRPVYFVREDWVEERYAHAHPGYKRKDRGHPGKGRHGRDD
ncbi:hypothetical protein [Azohydromonas sediminis]|uniref:hypothetical protein n=1 Tax=Azohydromonas sediminis TaxID=2259674 RepID=UPI0013C2DDD9|nr:hypothetical protein [Azohydromonas sediminis]